MLRLLLLLAVLIPTASYRPLTGKPPSTLRRTFLVSPSLLLLSTTPPPTLALDLDPVPAAFFSSPYYATTPQVTSSLLKTIELLDSRSSPLPSDGEITGYVQDVLFPSLKGWAGSYGFAPGVIKFQKRVYAPPSSFSSLLAVFDLLKKEVKQPKPGAPIDRLRGEVVEEVKGMILGVNEELKKESGGS